MVDEKGFAKVEGEKTETAKKRLNLTRKIMEYFFITTSFFTNYYINMKAYVDWINDKCFLINYYVSRVIITI